MPLEYQVLAEEAAVLTRQARGIIDEHDGRGEEMSAEVGQMVDYVLADAQARKDRADVLKRDVVRREAVNDLSAHFTAAGNGGSPGGGEGGEESPEQTDAQAERTRAFTHLLRMGRTALSPEELRVLTEGVETAGGYLVPEEFRNELIRKIAGLTIVRQRARILTISGDSAVVPKVTGGDNMYTSGVQVVWSSETPGVDEGLTDPAFGQERLLVYKMLAKTRLSKDLLEDSVVDITGLLSDLYAEAFALAEDTAFLTGSGVNRPEGVMTSPDVGATNTGDANTVTADGLIDLYYAVAVQYRARGVFVMRSSTEQVIRKLKDGNGQYLWQPSLQAGDPGMLLGRAVLNTDFMPAATAGLYPILFADFSGYWLVDRRALNMQRLDEKYAEQGMVGFVADKRVGGQVVQPYMFRKQLVSA